MEFLKATGVGGREGARERWLEWEQLMHHAGDDLLGGQVKEVSIQEGESPKVAGANAARQRNNE